jgi:toxin HigB-1
MSERKLFKDKQTEKVWNRIFVKKWSKELQKRSWEEMALLFSFSDNLNKLKEVFGKDLETLKGRRKGQYSIRVNDQFRICFVWEGGKIYEVELVDYHDERK